MALRLGGVDRPDRLLLRALGRLAGAPLRGRTLACPAGGALTGPARGPGPGPLRGDRRLPARGRDLRRPARDRSARPELRDHLPLRHHLARLSPVQRDLRQRLQAVQPLAGDRPQRRRALSARRRAAQRPPRLPGEAGPMAGRGRPGRGRLAGDRLRGQRRGRGRPGAPRRGNGGPLLHRLLGGDDGDLRHRGVVRARRDLLRLLRHVLEDRLPRRQRRQARSTAAALGDDQVGDRARLAGGRHRLDQHDQLRRRPGGRLQERPQPHDHLVRRSRRRRRDRRPRLPIRSSSRSP